VTAFNFDRDRLEQLTRAYGQEIFARVSQRSPLLFSPRWWDERLMDWTMHDETVKSLVISADRKSIDVTLASIEQKVVRYTPCG